MSKLKYALIGCGRIAPNHIVAAKNNDLEIVAICDTISDRMSDIVARNDLSPEVLKFTEYQEMLKKVEPDLVAVCTESGKHASIAIDCIESGCNVIIEKPIALSIEDADAIIMASKAHEVVVSACHQNRFNKSVKKIRKALENKRFGKLFHAVAHIRWNRGHEYYSQAKWRGTWEQDGGALMNQCIHNIDLLRWLMGNDIEEVFGYTDRLNHPYIEAEDLGIALVRFSNGAYGVIEGTNNVYPSNLEETLYIFGENGTVKAGGQSVNLIEEWRFADKIDDPEYVKFEYSENPPNVYGYGHTPLYSDVIEAIITGRQPAVTAEDGKRAIELVLAIYESAATGKTVKFPLLRSATVDFLGRFQNE